jgi:drug/metabolite transporter, DME family
MFATTITTGAVLGWLALGERVSRRSCAAIALLLASLGLLGLGAQAVGMSIAAAESVTTGPWTIAFAVAGAGLAGTVYSGLNIVIRHTVTRTTPPLAIAFLVPLSGMLSLGPIALCQSGVPTLPSLSGQEVLLMLAAGFFNLIGFVALIHGLKRTTVVYANAMNASQVAMATLAGMTLFGEPPNLWLLLGVGLTIVGIVWIDRPAEAIEDIPSL